MDSGEGEDREETEGYPGKACAGENLCPEALSLTLSSRGRCL